MPPSLRPFAVWVTDLTDRYRFNPFARTSVQIIALQILLVVVMLVLFAWGIAYTQSSTVASISSHLAEMVNRSATTTSPDLSESIVAVRNRTLIYVVTALLLISVLIGFLVSRFALRPARQALIFQKRFIGNIAHEIRTPLAIIKTSTEVALFDKNVPAQLRETLEGTIGELDRISETINNLLSFENLTRPGRMKWELVDLGAVTTEVVKRHESFAHSRDIDLLLNVRSHVPLSGNASAIDQVVTNLVKNAINYTPSSSRGRPRNSVTVTVDTNSKGNACIAVADTGIGISQKDLYHIFEPFYRGDTSRARGIGTGSSGLGLAIVNEIVRLHHGNITIRSALGNGTTIIISFPATGAPDLPSPLLGNELDLNSHEVSYDFS